MGGVKKNRKQYETPRKKWDRERLETEKKLRETYGLKNKREIRRTETILRKKRQNARELLALPLEERMKREKELVDSLKNMGLFKGQASLDDVLSLSLEELLERRLQTAVWRKNLAKTIKQARQFIVHGHIAVKGRKVSCPSYLIKAGEEGEIAYFKEPLQLEPPKAEAKKDVKKAFEEVAAAAEAEEKTAKGKEKTAGAKAAETEAGKVKQGTAGTAGTEAGKVKEKATAEGAKA